MRIRRVLACGLAMIAASTLATALAPLECPKGTVLKTGLKMKDGGTQDYCVDSVTGLAEGPVREFRQDGSLAAEGTNRAGKKEGVALLYGEDGALVGKGIFENDKFKSAHMNAAGLGILVDQMNAEFLASNKPFHLSVIDERTMGFDITVERDSAFSADEKAKFQDIYRNSLQVCRFFPTLSLDEIRLHLHTAKGLELYDFTMTAAECTAKQP